MNAPQRLRRMLLAAAGLVLAVNAIALGGVAYNRSGTPEAPFVFTERELALPYRWDRGDEDSGLALQLRWSVAEGDEADDSAVMLGRGTHVEWLDAAKLQQLGFDALPPRTGEQGPFRHVPPERSAWLALEFDGPQHQRRVEAAQRALARAQPGTHDEDAARDAYARVRDTSSRLVVVDAGPDADALRSRYPGAGHVIVSGRIGAYWCCETPQLTGYIGGIDIDQMHVPLQFRARLAQWLAEDGTVRDGARYTVAVAYGKRHEPWIVDVNSRDAR